MWKEVKSSYLQTLEQKRVKRDLPLIPALDTDLVRRYNLPKYQDFEGYTLPQQAIYLLATNHDKIIPQESLIDLLVLSDDFSLRTVISNARKHLRGVNGVSEKPNLIYAFGMQGAYVLTEEIIGENPRAVNWDLNFQQRFLPEFRPLMEYCLTVAPGLNGDKNILVTSVTEDEFTLVG